MLRRRIGLVGLTTLVWAACLSSCSADGPGTTPPAGAGDGGIEAGGRPTLPDAGDAPDAPDARGASPLWPTEGWQVRTPEAQGMDAEALELARSYAFQEGRNTQAVVVVRGGAIVAEWYAPNADADSYGASWSVAKSFTSALVGIAIEEGLIDGVDVSMAEFFPDWEGTDKEGITLRHVLQMASGLDWNEDYDPAALTSSDVIQLTLSGGTELEYASDRELVDMPGSVFNYSSGNTMLLSRVIEVATGMTAAEYAQEQLFDPIGIESAEWWRSLAGPTLTFCCLDMRSRDFARFGLLFARQGQWETEQVIPSNWIAESVSPSPAYDGYGYQWWLIGRTTDLPDNTYAAQGVDRQLIYVAPHLDLVVVRNGRYFKYDGPAVADPQLVNRYPPFGLNDELGTAPPDSWDNATFLGLVLDSVRDEARQP